MNEIERAIIAAEDMKRGCHDEMTAFMSTKRQERITSRRQETATRQSLDGSPTSTAQRRWKREDREVSVL